MSNLLQGLNIYLIGMMGCGKSTIGKQLARQLNYRFLDTDTLVETLTQQSIKHIFATEGEASFRQLETQVLENVSAYVRTVVSTGGGIILKPRNWSYLRYGLTIWLDAPLELLIKRLSQDTSRPLLQETDLQQKLTTLLQERQSLYAQADLRVPILPQNQVQDTTAQILELIPSVLKTPFSLN